MDPVPLNSLSILYWLTEIGIKIFQIIGAFANEVFGSKIGMDWQNDAIKKSLWNVYKGRVANQVRITES